jgi:asparagine synthase (glutamine-hydrolysing)
MRNFLALAGWLEVLLPAGSWLGADAAVRPLALTHLSGPDGGEPPPVATDEQRAVRAVLAGELYNASELRTALRTRHAVGADDAEVVAHLYEERGIQCVKALRGAFALAIWDNRLQRLMLARDQLGLVPLYYAADGDRLAVSSALPVLTARQGIPLACDPVALDAFLTFGAVPPPATLFPAIRQLRPGEIAVWEGGRMRAQRYWQLTFPERRLVRPEPGALLRGQIVESLRLRQNGGKATGLLLSTGLDAAALLALASAGECPFTAAYTAAVPGAGDGECRAAARLAAAAGVPHVSVTEAPAWATAADALLAAHGAPLGGPEAVAVAAAAARASADLDVLVAGVGGEEVVGGAAPVQMFEQIRRYRQLPGLVREGAAIVARLGPGRAVAGLRRVVEEARLAPLEVYGRTVSLLRPEERTRLYTPDIIAALGDARPWSVLAGLFAEAVAGGAEESADAIHYVELTLRLPPRVATMAAAAAAAGTTVRLPLADHRLAQFVASLPSTCRAGARERQRLLREAAADVLPRRLARAPHRVPAPAPPVWSTGGLRALVEETLTPARIGAQGYFRPEAVAELWREQLAGRRDHGARLWTLVLVTRWLDGLASARAPGIRAAG